MSKDYPPRVVAIEPEQGCCRIDLHTGSVLLIDLSVEKLEAYMQGQGFPPIAELIKRHLIVAYPSTVEMTATQWHVISTTLQSSGPFQEIAHRFPKLHSDIRLSYADVRSMPHHLYGGVGMFFDGKGLATLYTSNPLDFRMDEEKGAGWHFNLLVSGDNHLVWTWVNIQTNAVETHIARRPWHYVTNSSVD
jgi:hypothetical protein